MNTGTAYPLNACLAGYMAIFFNNGFAPDATNLNKYNMPYNLSFKDGNMRLNNFA